MFVSCVHRRLWKTVEWVVLGVYVVHVDVSYVVGGGSLIATEHDRYGLACRSCEVCEQC